jgi:hypothetical protein
LAGKLDALQGHADPHERVDSVWVLDRGMILNLDDRGSAETSPSEQTCLGTLASENPLLWLAIGLQDTFQHAWSHPFRLIDYVSPSLDLGTLLGVHGKALVTLAREAAESNG